MKKLAGGTVHKLPKDFRDALAQHDFAVELWQDITPLARNEWICWVISPKQEATRAKHIVVALDKMKKGERRPCCWGGCIHRTDKSMSRTQKWLAGK